MSARPVALVTGASRGIGRAIACGFAKDGYDVVAMARSEQPLLTLATEADVSPDRIIPICIDISDSSSVGKAIDSVHQKYGHIDVLVNNAGMGLLGTLDVNQATFESVLSTNLTGPFLILQKVVPTMLQQRKGAIFNIASRAGKIGFANFGAYAASKFALVGLGESLYRELCPKGIKVTTLCPSWVDTQMAQEAGTHLPGSEMIQCEDIVKTIRWVLSLSPAACVREILVECRADIA